jgi:hypothetical protein
MSKLLTHAETFTWCPAGDDLFEDEEVLEGKGDSQLYCPVCGGHLVESIL